MPIVISPNLVIPDEELEWKFILRAAEGQVTEHTVQIDKDLTRTFPGHPALASPEGQGAMRRILVAHSLHCPEV